MILWLWFFPRACEEPVGISLPDRLGGADTSLSCACPLASKGLTNTAVLGKQKPSSLDVVLVLIQVRAGLGMDYFVFCFQTF